MFLFRLVIILDAGGSKFVVATHHNYEITTSANDTYIYIYIPVEMSISNRLF